MATKNVSPTITDRKRGGWSSPGEKKLLNDAMAAARTVARSKKQNPDDLAQRTAETLIERYSPSEIQNAGALGRKIATHHCRNEARKRTETLDGPDDEARRWDAREIPPDTDLPPCARASGDEPSAWAGHHQAPPKGRGRSAKRGASSAQQRTDIQTYARALFERSTGVRWTPLLASTFASWIGPEEKLAKQYAEWNQDAKECRALDRALRRAIAYARARSARTGGNEFLHFIVAQLTPMHEAKLGMLESYGQTRTDSRDRRPVRFVGTPGFLGLARDRRASVDELTAMSILLDHDVQPRAGATAAEYFHNHRKRLEKHVRWKSQRARGQTPAKYWATLEKYGISSMKWPAVERVH